jgi:hypothetical protein
MENAGYMPTTLTAGESIWIAAANTAQSRDDITFDDYTPAHYTLAYQFAAATPITVAAVANGAGTGWTLDVTAAQTLTWKAGNLRYVAYATHTSTSRKFVVDSGVISVSPSPLATSAWTAVVAACDAALLAGATAGVMSLGVDGMSITYGSREQVKDLRNYAREMELRDTGNRPARIMRTRFT